MRTFYHHMHRLPILLLLMCTISCAGQDLKKGWINGPARSTDLQTLIKAGIDPYFIESTDTLSAHGPGHITRDLLQDRNGTMWFATWKGIISYDGKVFTNHTLKDNLIHFHVVSVFEDSKGNIWCGTARGGLYRYNTSTPGFKLFTTKESPTSSLIIGKYFQY